MRDYCRKLRQEQTSFDVTLATADGEQVKAHRVILSAGSSFFDNIFSNAFHPNTYVCMKGIKKAVLENIIDFLYNGETNIIQEELATFLETAEELTVKGLQYNLDTKAKSNSQTVYH